MSNEFGEKETQLTNRSFIFGVEHILGKKIEIDSIKKKNIQIIKSSQKR